MAYTKTIWTARQGTGLDRFIKLQETAAVVFLVNEPERITQAGTPFSVDNMNHIEQGIADAHDAVGLEGQLRRDADQSEAELRIAADRNLSDAIGQEALLRKAADQDLAYELSTCWNAFDYLVNFIKSKYGAIGSIPIATEGGLYLITESGDHLVTA